MALGPLLLFLLVNELLDANGLIASYLSLMVWLNDKKAHLVILDSTQIEGQDFIETFVHVAKLITVPTLLTVIVVRGWELHQMDVHNSFLHGDLSEEVYIKLPPDLHPTHPNQVYCLKKSLHSLCQAPCC